MSDASRSAESEAPRRGRPRWLRFQVLVIAYLVALAASHVVRVVDPRSATLRPEQVALEIPEFDEVTPLDSTVTMAWTDYPGPSPDAPVVLLVHGSPVASIAMVELAEALSRDFRVLLPDLPSMGNSTRWVEDYSVRAHAAALEWQLGQMGLSSVHCIGYSMGGGVILELFRQNPERVESLAMLAAIGVQEFELLGDYHLNHAVHGLQLAGLRVLEEAFPHFGVLDTFPLATPYARNFFDTDQRPLRGVLQSVDIPLLVIHGQSDLLVPKLAALEHHRIVPQSELVLFEGGHISPLKAGPEVVDPLVAFVEKVERGEGLARAAAVPERVVEADRPFDRRDSPTNAGMAMILAITLLALATLASEDLACLGGGILVANGSLSFSAAVAGCATGILVGDIGLFILGRIFGRRLVRKAPFRYFISESTLERAAAWLDRRGAGVIFASRFTPGLRVPTYLAAGILETRFFWFVFYFVLATVLWTPAAVGLGALVGRPILNWAIQAQGYAGWILLAEVLLLLAAWKLIVPAFTARGRRQLLGRWIRWRRFEYWPTWIFYPPLVFMVMGVMLRHRNPALCGAANPGIEHGGFIGESKEEILTGLANAGDVIAAWRAIPERSASDGGIEARVAEVEEFRASHGFDWPVVLKPDRGERGSGVVIVRSTAQVRSYLEQHPLPVIVQEFVPGLEFGVFYARHPDEETGRIISITDKRFPSVVGDGVRTLERLILDDRTILPMAGAHLSRLGARAEEVPAAGETVKLIEIGTHCLGSIFLDGGQHITPELTSAIDRISQTFDGFFFGRYDVRVSSIEEFESGRGFRVIELNGVSSEATHIYDPKHGVLFAYRTLFQQWRLAYRIGAANQRRGAEVPTTWSMVRRLLTSDPRPKLRLGASEIGDASPVPEEASRS